MSALFELTEQEVVDKLLELVTRGGPTLPWFQAERVVSWFGVGLKPQWILGTRTEPETYPGDIDLLAGLVSVEWKPDADPEIRRITEQMQVVSETWDHVDIQWPPRLDDIWAVEAKVHGIGAGGQPKGFRNQAKPGRSGAKQAGKLVRAGFDRVTLLDVVTAEILNDPQYHAWLLTLGHASSGVEKFNQHAQAANNASTPPEFGRIALGWGQVAGKDVVDAGSLTARTLHDCGKNPRLHESKVIEARTRFRDALRRHLRYLPVPTRLPVILRHCPDCLDHRIFMSHDSTQLRCDTHHRSLPFAGILIAEKSTT